MTLEQLAVVVAGLDPAIRVLVTGTGDAGNRVDARVKPAYDDLQLFRTRDNNPFLFTGQPCAAAGIQERKLPHEASLGPRLRGGDGIGEVQ
jgi:hypothetical protein